MRSRQGKLCIGTSGWSYDHWQGRFYPKGLAPGERLAFYAGHFGTVEINNSFYSLPAEQTLRHWCETVSGDFVFAAKASRYITHMKKLKDAPQILEKFLARISVLGHRLGPLLFQLPPRWGFNADRLAAFLAALDGDFRCAFEFRDHSWLTPRAFDLLAQYGAALCIYDLDGFISPKEVTADFVYIRLHGPDDPYRGSYDDATLSGWADALSSWSATGRDVYCYFDNDEAGYAARDAARLLAMLRDRTQAG